MSTISTLGACVVPALANSVMVAVATEGVAETSAAGPGSEGAPQEATITRDTPTEEEAGREWRAPGDTWTSTQSAPLQDLFKVYQVWSLTQFYSVDFSQSRIEVKKCVFNKRTIKVCVSCC